MLYLRLGALPRMRAVYGVKFIGNTGDTLSFGRKSPDWVDRQLRLLNFIVQVSEHNCLNYGVISDSTVFYRGILVHKNLSSSIGIWTVKHGRSRSKKGHSKRRISQSISTSFKSLHTLSTRLHRSMKTNWKLALLQKDIKLFHTNWIGLVRISIG
jgi:hypothetical protein